MRRRINPWQVLAVAAALIAIAAGIAWHSGVFRFPGPRRPANSIMVIMPYRYAGAWVFDDEALGLRREAFVAGTPGLIDELVKDIPAADQGFCLLFSAQPFPGYARKLTWRRGDKTGNWYYCAESRKEGWLCPGLFKYYREAPREIYVRAEKK
jgi:hypothetical protein